MRQLDLFRDLIVMATIDGKLTESEIAFLSERAQRWGIDEATFAQTLEQALAPSRQVKLPATRAEREQLLEEFLRMMAADGQLAEQEKRLFARAAVAMDFLPHEIDVLIDRLVSKKANS